MILGETYKVNDLILGNMQSIDTASEQDVPRIVELFGRIREQDSWGFDPGNRFAEEDSFKHIIESDDSMVFVYRDSGKAQGYIHIAFAMDNDTLDIEIKEVAVDKHKEGRQIAKALSFYAIQQIETRFKDTVTKYRLNGVSANKKIYGERGLATKSGFSKSGDGFEYKLTKEIEISPFSAIQILQAI